MALDTERSGLAESPWTAALRPLRGLASFKLPDPSSSLTGLGHWFGRQPIIRFFTSSLLRRILISNLVGLVLLLGGMLYLGQHHAWLIDAKRDSLRVQGEIIAAAIAANATLSAQQEITFEPGSLPDAEDGARFMRGDDALSSLELSIRPERVARILHKLVKPTDNRARIYGQDGTLVIDSEMLVHRGRAPADPAAGETTKTKNFWTRLQHWLIDKELPVYKDIGSGKGTAYPEVRMALSGTTTPMLLLNEKGEQIVSMAVPIKRAKDVQGVLLLSTQPGEIDRILFEERSIVLAMAALALAATIVASLLLARTVAGPMRRLSATAELVSRDITARKELPHLEHRSDEVGQMASAFRSMTSALYRRIEASEKFAADVAHELKNPLTAARSVAESLAYAKTTEQRDQLVQQIQTELQRLNRLITDVSNASRLDAELARQQMGPLNVTTTLSAVRDIFRDMLQGESRRISLVIESSFADQSFMVSGHDGRLGQVLTNLVDNALSFSPEGATVTLRARHKGPDVELIVEDEGPGIPEDRLDAVFDRFYSDRPMTDSVRGKNSGLGLSISREIVNAHGGRIWAENRPTANGTPGTPVVPAGARFIVQLPALNSARSGVAGGRRV